MLGLIGLAALGLILAYSYQTYASYQKNLAAVKASGIPYVSIPIYTFSPVWLLIYTFFWPLIMKIPEERRPDWLVYLSPEYIWLTKRQPFEKFGADMLFIVSPGKNTLMAANAEAITQITTRRNDFPKPIELYRGVDIYGKNVVSTEGSLWRHHRKITSPPFTEKNNKLVWNESLHQAEGMVRACIGPEDTYSKPLYDVNDQAMRLSLHIISRAGFGEKLKWPHEEKHTVIIPPGHTLTFKDALSTLLHNLLVLLLTPRWFLTISPLNIHKTTKKAYTEWGKYMREMYDSKRAAVSAGESSDGMDLMGALVKGSGITEGSLGDEKAAKVARQSAGLFTDDEILGNAFVFILAGHETTANTIHYSCLLLAMFPESQRHLQRDLDKILGDRAPEEWSYETDMPKLFGGMCGAVMNEQLRLIAPVTGIPKSTSKNSPQGIQIDGKHHIIPGNAAIVLNTPATHRNPRYWPHTSIKDLNEFRPERWLVDDSSQKPRDEAEEIEPEYEGPDKRADTADDLYRPIKGSYIPFSDGFRSCLGRRFAQVEILAVIAVIFKNYSVELDVSKYLSDEEFASASQAVKQAAWDRSKARAQELLDHHMLTIITIMLRDEKPGLRFVKRGHERFSFVKG